MNRLLKEGSSVPGNLSYADVDFRRLRLVNGTAMQQMCQHEDPVRRFAASVSWKRERYVELEVSAIVKDDENPGDSGGPGEEQKQGKVPEEEEAK